MGPTGPQGPPGQGGGGTPGPPGPEGPAGPQGPQGVQGDTGDQGVEGPQGPSGTQGIQGVQGAPGQSGASGSDGEDGAQGPQGVPGNTGPAGPEGPEGPEGPQGQQGIQGIQGLQGIQGNPGANGSNGTNGQGVPTGGSTNQVLAKTSGTDFATAWVTPAAGSAAILTNASTGDVVASGADTYLAASSLLIGARQKAGTIIRWRVMMTKSGAGTATPIFNIRFGTNGTIADTARVTLTGVNQTAASDTGWVDIEAIVRVIGAAGNVHGGMSFEHFNTTTGFANKAQVQILRQGSANFDNTNAGLFIGLSVHPGASGVWTFQHVSAEALNLN